MVTLRCAAILYKCKSVLNAEIDVKPHQYCHMYGKIDQSKFFLLKECVVWEKKYVTTDIHRLIDHLSFIILYSNQHLFVVN